MLFILRVEKLEANLQSTGVIEMEDEKKNLRRLSRKASHGLFLANVSVIKPKIEKYGNSISSFMIIEKRC